MPQQLYPQSATIKAADAEASRAASAIGLSLGSEHSPFSCWSSSCGVMSAQVEAWLAWGNLPSALATSGVCDADSAFGLATPVLLQVFLALIRTPSKRKPSWMPAHRMQLLP
jgi:hypothetical protein